MNLRKQKIDQQAIFGLRGLLLLVFVGLIGGCLLPSALLAETFPSEPLTMIVPYKAGGSTDTMARVLAKALKDELGQPVIVVNRSGAGGSIGATFLMKSKPDGYTILLGGSEIPTLNPIVQKVEFTKDNFTYLAAISEYQNALVALSEKPYKTLVELIEYSKTHPGIKIATQTPVDLMILTKISAINKLDWKLISTKGGGESFQMLFGKKVAVTYSGGAHAQYKDKLTVLVSLNKGRLAANPDKPSLMELGYDMMFPSPVTLMGPKGIPDEIAAVLEEAVLNASQTEDFKNLVEERFKFPVIKLTSEQLEAYIPVLENQLKKMME